MEQQQQQLIDEFFIAVYSVLNVIYHKKKLFVSLNESELLQQAVDRIKDLTLHENDRVYRIYHKCIEIIEFVQRENAMKRRPVIPKGLIADVIFPIERIKSQATKIEILISDGFSINCNILTPYYGIPRLTITLTTNPMNLATSTLKSVFIEQVPYKGYFYSVEKYGGSPFLKLSIGNGEEINRTLLMTISNDSDAILLSLDLFEKYFDVIKENKTKFRYIEVYYDKTEHDEDEGIIRQRAKELYARFDRRAENEGCSCW
jgi:hypothetical protein